MAITPAGSISLSLACARGTLAACGTWQTITGTSDAAAAANRIFYGYLPPPRDGRVHTLDELRAYRPFALLRAGRDGGTEDGFTRQIVAADPHGDGDDSGVIRVEIERDIPDALLEDPAAAELEATNIAGAIVDELMALAGRGGYLAVKRVSCSPVFRSAPDEETDQGNSYMWYYVLEWGIA